MAGHDAGHVVGARAVVHTAAVPLDHVELEAARVAGIPVISRAEALWEVVADGEVVAVAGTHGKTTVTAMVTTALVAAGRDPTGIVGGRVEAWDGNARVGGDALYVVEADEYDRSFLSLTPSLALVNNVEVDHLECYGSHEELEAAFVEFAGRAKRALIGADDKGAGRVAGSLGIPVWRVGTASGADIRLSDLSPTKVGSRSRISFPNGASFDLRLNVPGFHNARNAAMALAAVFALGADVGAAIEGVEPFTGVGRRFEMLGEFRGVMLVDDYAHHPSEVIATLAAARQRFPGRRIVAVFQPHLYSRTRAMGSQFGISLSVADLVVVTDVYPAREQPIRGVTGKLVVRAARRAGVEVVWVPAKADLPGRLEEIIADGDVVLTMGAGDITEVGPALAKRLSGMAA